MKKSVIYLVLLITFFSIIGIYLVNAACTGSSGRSDTCTCSSDTQCASGNCCGSICYGTSNCKVNGVSSSYDCRCCSEYRSKGICACKPNCVFKTCGDDGCGGSCGTCTDGK
ncbi:MAG: hypothetical protein V1815_00270, partial [Candidatus Woesearchaeota archaeon]